MRDWFTLLIVLVLVALNACGSSDQGPNTPTPPPPPVQADPLRNAGAVSGKMVGTAVQTGLLRTAQYATVAGRHFNYLTAEYEMKMATIGQSPGAYNFAPGDALVAFAAANGMRVKGHAFVWHGTDRCRPGSMRCRPPI
jgi:endo-1,4-beta-xylanase